MIRHTFYGLIAGLFMSGVLMAGCAAEQENTEALHHADDGHQQGAPAPSGTIGELDWCSEHSVPESECTRCDTSRIAHFKDTGDWCAGHDLPESHCRLCNPGITFPQETILLQQKAELSAHEFDVTLQFRDNQAVCATNDAIIQLASAQTVERAGISVETAWPAQLETTIDAPAEVRFDESEATVVASSVAALVSRWLVSPGETVAFEAPLAILKAPEVAQLKSSLLAAHAHYEVERKELERHRSMHSRKLISDAELDRQIAAAEEARVEFVSAEGLLLSAGMAGQDIQASVRSGDVSNEFILRAPAAGMIVERMARLGDLQEAGRAFAMMADPEAMWIEAQLSERELGSVAVGQELVFSADGRGLDRVAGRIIWVSRFVDSHTRKGIVRARVANPMHGLLAGAFGRVRIVVPQDRRVVTVPKGAVQWEGCCNVVFVRESPTRFRPRKVELEGGSGPYYQVSTGVSVGEQVVVDGAFLLKTELKKSSIGAGCCGLDPVS